MLLDDATNRSETVREFAPARSILIAVAGGTAIWIVVIALLFHSIGQTIGAAAYDPLFALMAWASYPVHYDCSTLPNAPPCGAEIPIPSLDMALIMVAAVATLGLVRKLRRSAARHLDRNSYQRARREPSRPI